MQSLDLSLGLVLVVSSLGTAALALFFMGYLIPPRKVSWTPLDQIGERVVFLFRDRELVDATPDARALLETGPEFLDDWPRVLAVIENRFPDFGEEICELADRQHIVLSDPGSDDRVEAEWRGGLARIVLWEAGDKDASDTPDRFSQAAFAEELATLRGVIDDAPMLIWKEDSGGAVRWANGAYVDLVQRVAEDPETVGWPLPRLFEQRPIGPDMADPPRRLSIEAPESESSLWFDSYDEADGDGVLVFALPADKLVRAESSLREFVQTLTKTFAHLPTGLAVFDKERRLALFNPALTDLSALEPMFLSSRPTLFEFLDRLRERQRMPEPKDYKGWRLRISDLENAAASGTHQETWSLPGGQTYRVTGRPHPDGAVAFLFEDISAEVSVTRRFRAELDLGKAVLDSLEEAVAVFSSAGSLVFCNHAYSDMWDHDASTKLGDLSVSEATRLWQTRCHPTPVWGDLRDFAMHTGERAEWTADIHLVDGTPLICRFTPLIGHATLVGFSRHAEATRATGQAGKVWTKMPAALR